MNITILPRSSFTLMSLIVLVASFVASGSAKADSATDWNVTTMNVLTVAGPPAPPQARAFAMVHSAIHDALNTIAPRYRTYATNLPPDPVASPDAAVAASAHDVLLALYPAQQQTIDNAYQAALAPIPEGEAKTRGINLGQSVARRIIDLRRDDGSGTTMPYEPGTGPGEWQPTPPAFGPAVLPHWRFVLPFTLKSPSQFRSSGPPSLYSVAYARDLVEVFEVGDINSTTRTADQSEIAQFWYEMSHFTWAQIARIMSAQRGLELWQNARLYALLGLAAADVFIAGWDTKYEFRFWRPVTAIRFSTDSNWLPYLATPAHMDYVSTHSVSSGAFSVVLASVFGGDEAEFRLTTSSAPEGAFRSFTSFSQASQENQDSRVYAGIHFRTACSDGANMGGSIGSWAIQNYLQPMGPQ